MRRKSPRGKPSAEPLTLHIDKLSHEGRGIAHHEGRVIFVDGALPHETVLAQLSSQRGSYAEANTLEVLSASADRVTPPCPHFTQCGGCSLQHLSSAAQLRFKDEALHERLSHETGLAAYQRLPVLSGEVLGYRRKARLALRYVAKKQRVLVGFRERQGNFITDMQSCAVLDPRVGTLLVQLSELAGAMHARESVPQIEVALGDTDTSEHGALVVRHLQPLSASDTERLIAFGMAQGLSIYLQPKGPDSVHKLYPQGGAERLYYRLPAYNLELAFHPLDFTQVNAGINRLMLDQALHLLDPQAQDKVLDLFCGLGNFTLPLARRAREVLGVEGVAAMVRRGEENAARNGITNAAFVCADLSLPPAQHPWLQQGFDKVLLDPPRSGALEVLPALIAARPARIVYVSCNPATLARDAAVLHEHGYTLAAAGAMDMFPHTSHVEAMALFLPRNR
ncbi:MAG: 23S rRNA (uracil(1939)-C(5))-methyltransferase RlmD [Pseudomonadales bacterium]|jgi:23S rRNA (uracil1939-C5)-methyltransferase|nr:23S rRNA (uracil(1939)-C(5))-methyltransferase RlmD [Pseudomonadales bacterium]